jgi:tetratricopeptide (TPR) repeat protein
MEYSIQAERLLRRGQRLAAQGRYHEASAALNQARQLRPRAAGLTIQHALVLAELDQMPEAVQALEQAMALQPQNPVPPLFLGRLYWDHAEYAKAAYWCERVLALQSTSGHALALQALIELASGEVQQACQRLLQPPSFPIPTLVRACLWLGHSQVPSLLQQANAALQGRVLLQTERLLLAHASQAQTLAQQVLAIAASHQDEKIADRLMMVLDQGLTWVIMQTRRLYSLLRYAMQSEQRALHLRLLQAENAAYHGQAAAAQTLYTQIARQYPELPGLDEHLCEAYYAQGKFHDALRHVERLRKTLPDPEQPPTEMRLFLGELYCEVSQFEAAVVLLSQPPTGPMRDYRWAYYLGLCHVQTGAFPEARRAFIRAVQQIHPNIVALRLRELSRLS